MLSLFLTASLSFFITFLAIPVVLFIAEKKKLYDIPDERKIHTAPVSSLGGIGIFAGFLLASLLSIQSATNAEFQYFFAAMIIVFFIGLKDDLVILSATKKLFGQILAASIVVHLGGLRLDSLHGLFGIEELPVAFSMAITYLSIIVIINSFNLIDGIDGLATSLGILTMSLFGLYFFAVGMAAYALLSFGLAGSLVAFLIFNHHPAKIFMGDSGSLIIGLVNAILVIKFINVASEPTVAIPVPAAVAIGFSILIVPLLDTLRVFSVRIFNGRSPFAPDRNHIHHLLLDRGMNHAAVTFTCVTVNILIVFLAWFAKPLGVNIVMAGIFVISFAGIGLLYFGRRRNKTRMVIAKNINGSTSLKTPTKVVTLTTESSSVSDENL